MPESSAKMRWAGVGAELWRVRVDLFAQPHDSRRQINQVAEALRGLLTANNGDARPDIAVDQGTGTTTHPVVGLLFWVKADDVGGAATTALDIARQAGNRAGVGPELYDVTVIPRAAVVLPNDRRYPRMPD
jgi:hypothetical protein